MASFQEKSRTVGREAKLGLKALGHEICWLQALEYTTFWLKVPGCTTFGLNCMSLGLCRRYRQKWPQDTHFEHFGALATDVARSRLRRFITGLWGFRP